MRVQLASDLHFEFHRDAGASLAASVPVAGDVLVLAGDITPLDDVGRVAARLRWFTDRFAHVVWVPGNHEYYGTTGVEGARLLAAVGARLKNLHVLDGGMITIEGVRFVGATLWFPLRDEDLPLRRLLNDFRMIRDAVPWIGEEHARHRAFLEREVRQGDVVVTHHLPHVRSVPPAFKDSPINRFFVVPEVTPLLEERGAALWLHGHTHFPADYVVGRTRVVANPLGYPKERPFLPAWREALVLEVEAP